MEVSGGLEFRIYYSSEQNLKSFRKSIMFLFSRMPMFTFFQWARRTQVPRTYPILYVLFTYIVTISVAVLGILGSLMAMEGLKSLLTAPTIFTGFSSFRHEAHGLFVTGLS